MDEKKNSPVDVAALLRAEAMQKMQKSQNRVKSTTLLTTLVEFVNSGDGFVNVSEKFPTIGVSRWQQIIKSNDALNGRVWPIKSDEFGICLVNVTPDAQ